MGKKIGIFGHRNVPEQDKLKIDLKGLFEMIIENSGDIFIFGSKSEFNDMCYQIVNELRKNYNHIVMWGYLCAKEIAFTHDEAQRYSNYINKQIEKGRCPQIFDKIEQFDFDNKNLYIERNKKIIVDCDICVFYYRENKLSPTNKFGVTTKSGTFIALQYAKSKNKKIIIV